MSEHILSSCPGGTSLFGGYRYDPKAIDAFCSMLADIGHEPEGHRIAAANFADEQKDVILAYYLFKAFPNWKSGRQLIGDCVSWSCAQSLDVLGGVQAFMINYSGPPQFPAATECMYGLMRVNVYGRPDYGGDGANGSDAAKAVMEIGTLHRTKYAVNGKDYDFTSYSKSRASSFGATGVPKDLEPVANEHKVITATQIKDFDTAAKFIMNGYPIENAHSSNPTCEGNRDKDGFGTGRGYAHAMNYIGVRFGSRPGLLKTNTGWANTVTGPMWPNDIPEALTNCAWWEDADTCTKVLKAGDCYAYSKYEGFKAQNLPSYGTSEFL